MASTKAIITENVQGCLETLNWQAAIEEMEKLFRIDQDPLIRVRIGDARRKLNKTGEAIREYVRAAELFAERGFIGKALAQYNLILRLDAANEDARSRREKLSARRWSPPLRREPVEYRIPLPHTAA
jgi:tetratricopeptide (TPR) repeat protein